MTRCGLGFNQVQGMRKEHAATSWSASGSAPLFVDHRFPAANEIAKTGAARRWPGWVRSTRCAVIAASALWETERDLPLEDNSVFRLRSGSDLRAAARL